MKWLIRIGVVLGVLILVVALGVWWLVGTASGLRFALERAKGFTDHALSVDQAEGRLARSEERHVGTEGKSRLSSYP